ncbi:MAG: antibiotic biosynthesis monooxygenase [Chloroflexi bacterium]|nr:antibiotic biosynthesis monooxygenase [Chloroflexota bacterium]
MAVKVLIRREIIPGNERIVQELLVQLRTQALKEPGYVSGETLINSENPHAMVVISTWSNQADWRRWQESETRKRLDGQLQGLLAAPESVQVLRERNRDAD